MWRSEEIPGKSSSGLTPETRFLKWGSVPDPSLGLVPRTVATERKRAALKKHAGW